MQINFSNFTNVNQGNEEFMKICEKHEGCKDCPLLKGSVNIGGFETICDTGMAKDKKE